MRIRILAGQYFDEETGLHYNYHRYYDPKIGRYLTPDPIGLTGGINLFTYTENNPINKFDFLGLTAGVMPTPYGPVPIPIIPPSFEASKPDSESNSFPFGGSDISDDQCENKKTCDTEHPDLIKCSELPFDYEFENHIDALDFLKDITGRKNLKIVSKSVATGGPAPGQGKHYGVKGPGKPQYKVSLMSSPCCEDTPNGPVVKEMWRYW